MLRFMTACFLLLGWTFYEASGGAEFAPPASAASPAPVIAASSDDPRLLEAELTIAARGDEAARSVPDPMPVEIVSRAATDLGPVAALPAAPETVVPQDTKAMFAVTGNGVNMRSGPGTSHGVIVSLPFGAKAEVIGSEGNWNNIRLEDGTEGWMSANFLSEV